MLAMITPGSKWISGQEVCDAESSQVLTPLLPGSLFSSLKATVPWQKPIIVCLYDSVCLAKSYSSLSLELNVYGSP